MRINFCKEDLEDVKRALQHLDWYFSEHNTVETPFGSQCTINGYQLDEIRIAVGFISISVFMLDRCVQHKDMVRMGDKAHFIYYRRKKKIVLDEGEKR